MLFEAAGIDPSFIVRRMLSGLLVAEFAASKELSPEIFAELIAEAAKLEPRQHRAERDARHLAAQWLAVIKY